MALKTDNPPNANSQSISINISGWKGFLCFKDPQKRLKNIANQIKKKGTVKKHP